MTATATILPYTEARTRLRAAFENADPEYVEAISDILRLGAGHLPSPGVLTSPVWLPPERREAYIACIEALAFLHEDAADFGAPVDSCPLVRAGEWEAVLASLVVLGDRETILSTARELKECDK